MKILKWILIILAGLFLIVILAIGALGAWIYWGHPFGIDVPVAATALISPESVESSYDHPALSTQAEVLLESAGIDVSKIPTSVEDVSEEQKDCLLNAVGEARIQELLNGATPSFSDAMATKPCFE